MRANGVGTLAAWRHGRSCDHFRIVDVSAEAQALAGNRRQHFQYLQGRGRQLRRPEIERAPTGCLGDVVGALSVSALR